MAPKMRHLIASALVVALSATFVPFTAPASAAEVGISAVGTAALRAVSAVNANTIVAVAADGQIWRTTDGGTTWASEHTSSYSWVGVDFWDASNGFAVDAGGMVTKTTNGGDTWVNKNDIDQGLLLAHGKASVVPGTGWQDAIAAAGDADASDDNLFGGVPFKTTGTIEFWGMPNNLMLKPHVYDDGMIISDQGEALLLDVDFISSTMGVTAGIDYYPLDPKNLVKYPLYTTADGGGTWTERTVGNGTDDLRLSGVALGSTTAGVTVGSLVADSTARAFYTTNGGTAWTASTLPSGFTAALNGVDMSSATQGWAVAENGTILKTTDGGATWSYCSSVPAATPALYDIDFLDGTTVGYAVGANGAALRTTDGDTWTEMPGGGGDTTPPTMGTVTSSTHPAEGSWYPNNDPALEWTSATDASGIAGYSYILDTSPSTTPDTVLEPAGTSTSYTDKADGLWYFHIRAQDNSANHTWSTVTHRAVRIDTTEPSGTVSINGTATSTNTRNVTLTLNATDANSGVYQMRVSEDSAFSGVSWEAYATSKPFTLSAGDGTKTVYAQFRDNAGNVSNTFLDMIVLDTTTPVEPTFTQFAGANRYQTAIFASQSAYPTGSCDSVVIATGVNFPDALSAAGLGGAVGAPVLLVNNSNTLGDTLTEIKRLTSGRASFKVYIMGGTAAVPLSMENAIKAGLSGETVERFAGTDRYHTARLVAAKMKSLLGASFGTKAMLIPGFEFTDGLIVGPAAYAEAAPILLVGPTADQALVDTLKALGTTDLYVCGSAARIPASTEASLKGLVPGLATHRTTSAADAYVRSAEAAEFFTTPANGFGLGWSGVGIATGERYPDGLAAGCIEGPRKTPLLLTRVDTLPASVNARLVAHKATITAVRFYGGDAAVSPAVRTTVANALK